MRTFIISIAFFLLILLISFARADQGLIPVFPNVTIYEPGQKAIVAWNGTQEILILSTDIMSTSDTQVVQLLPLPSEPEIELASLQSFREIQTLIWDQGAATYGTDVNQARGASIEIVFHEKIGAHNITVARATDSTNLVAWIKDLLLKNNISQTVTLGEFEPVVRDYMGRGFRYYVLDLVAVNATEKSVDPILYRFQTDFLYYPLAITSPVQGTTTITLFLLSTQKVNKSYPLQKAYYMLSEDYKPIEFTLSKGTLSTIDLRIGDIFEKSASLTVLTYNGSPSLLTTDLMIAQNDLTSTTDAPETSPSVNVQVFVTATEIALFIILGAACTLIGVLTATLVTRPKREATR